MIIIKDWHNRYGLNARFYKIGNQFFIDYMGCRETSEVYITIHNGVVHVQCQMPDVPRSYVTAIVRLLQNQVQPVKHPVKKASGGRAKTTPAKKTNVNTGKKRKIS